MFQNPGEKLGEIVKVITFLVMIVCVIAGFVLSDKIHSVFVLLGILAAFLVWIGSLLILAFCDLCTNMYYIRKKMEQMDLGGVSRESSSFERLGEPNVEVQSGFHNNSTPSYVQSTEGKMNENANYSLFKNDSDDSLRNNSTPSYVRSTEGKLNEDANYSLFKNKSDSSHSPKVTAPVQTPINSTKWYCSQCGYANLSSYSYCMQCGLQKAEK